jgi:hypothetical protein
MLILTQNCFNGGILGYILVSFNATQYGVIDQNITLQTFTAMETSDIIQNYTAHSSFGHLLSIWFQRIYVPPPPILGHNTLSVQGAGQSNIL